MSSQIPYVSDYRYVTPPPRTKDEKELWRLLINLHNLCKNLEREREEMWLETSDTTITNEEESSNDAHVLQQSSDYNVKMADLELYSKELYFRSAQQQQQRQQYQQPLLQTVNNKVVNCHVKDNAINSNSRCSTSFNLFNKIQECRVDKENCIISESESESECADQTFNKKQLMTNMASTIKKSLLENNQKELLSELVHSVEEVEDLLENEEQTGTDEKYAKVAISKNTNFVNCMASLQRYLSYLHDEQIEIGASALDVAIQLPDITLRRMIVQTVLQHPWLNFDGCAPVIVAITVNDSAIVERLLDDMRLDVNSGFPLAAAIRLNRMAILELLLISSRINVNHGNAFFYAVMHHNTTAIELLSNHTSLDPNRSCQGYCITPLVFVMRQFIQSKQEEMNLNYTWEEQSIKRSNGTQSHQQQQILKEELAEKTILGEESVEEDKLRKSKCIYTFDGTQTFQSKNGKVLTGRAEPLSVSSTPQIETLPVNLTKFNPHELHNTKQIMTSSTSKTTKMETTAKGVRTMRKSSLSSTSSLPSLSSLSLSSSAMIGNVVHCNKKNETSAPHSVEQQNQLHIMLLEEDKEGDFAEKRSEFVSTQFNKKRNIALCNNDIDKNVVDNKTEYDCGDDDESNGNNNNKTSEIINTNKKQCATTQCTQSQHNGQTFTFPAKPFMAVEHINAYNSVKNNYEQKHSSNAHLQTHSYKKNTLHTNAQTWLEVFRLLLSIPTIDVNGGFIFTPLQLAIMHGSNELVYELLEHPLLQPNKVPSSSRTLACAFNNLFHESSHSWSHSTSHSVHGHLSRNAYKYNKLFSAQTLHCVTCTPLMLATQQRRLDLFELLLSDRRVMTPMIVLNELERDVHDSFALTFVEVWGTYVPQWEGWAWRWRRRVLCTACLAMCLLTSVQFIFGIAHAIHWLFICDTSAEDVANIDNTLLLLLSSSSSSCSTGASLLGNAFYVIFGTDFIASVIAVVSTLSQSQDKSFYSQLERYRSKHDNDNRYHNDLNNPYSNHSNKVNNDRFHSSRNTGDDNDHRCKTRCKSGSTYNIHSHYRLQQEEEHEKELQELQQHEVWRQISNNNYHRGLRNMPRGNNKPHSVSVHQQTPWHSSAFTLMELTPLSSHRLQSLLKSYDIHDKTSLYNMRLALRRAYWRYYKHFFKTQTDMDHVDELLFHYNESCQLRSTVVMFLLKWLFVLISPFVPIIELWCTVRMLSLYFARQAHPQPYMRNYTQSTRPTQSMNGNMHSNYAKENIMLCSEEEEEEELNSSNCNNKNNYRNSTPNCVINVEPHVHRSNVEISRYNTKNYAPSSHTIHFANNSSSNKSNSVTHYNNVCNSELISYSCPSLPLTEIKIKEGELLEEESNSAHEHMNRYKKHCEHHNVASVNQTLTYNTHHSECERERLTLHSRGIKKRVSFNLKPAHTVMYDKASTFALTATAPTVTIAPSTPVQKHVTSMHENSCTHYTSHNNLTNAEPLQQTTIANDECALQETLLKRLLETHAQEQQRQQRERQVQTMKENICVNNTNSGKIVVAPKAETKTKSSLCLPHKPECNSNETREHQHCPKAFAREVLYHVPNLYLRRAIYLSYETIVPSRLFICIVAIFIHLVLLFPSDTNNVYEPPHKSILIALSTVCLICSIIAGGALLLSLLVLRHTNKFTVLAGKENHIHFNNKDISKNINNKEHETVNRIGSDSNMENRSENIADNVNVVNCNVEEDWQSCDEIDYQSNFYMTKGGSSYNSDVTT